MFLPLVIIDRPYASEELLTYLQNEQVIVLDSPVAREMSAGFTLNFVPDFVFTELATEENARLYTLSEHSLDWVLHNIEGESLHRGIKAMKNKDHFRKLLAPLYPEFFYETLTLEELTSYTVDESKLPFVLKPAVGFFSVGVYTITNKEDFSAAVKSLMADYENWKNLFPESVVAAQRFILEAFIHGEEYAIDAYYNDNGEAVVVNVMHHLFSSMKDVSDRLYYTSEKVIREFVPKFQAYLNEIGTILNLKNFPLHMEVRVREDGSIIPIESNPMRFAGWSCTDIAFFAYALPTYHYYLNNEKPDWDRLLEGTENKRFALVILDKPASFTKEQVFDYEKLCNDFQRVICLRKLDYLNDKPFGFLFTETSEDNLKELETIMCSDLTEYLH